MTANAPGDEASGSVVAGYAFPASIRVGVFGTFLILFLGALFYARGFVLPLVLACLLTLTLSPLVRRLRRFGMPTAVSAILLVGALGVGLAVASVFLSEPVSKMAAQMPQTITKVRERLDFLRQPVATLNSAGREIENMLNGSADGAPSPTVVVADGALVRWLLGTLADFGTTITATLMLAAFLLASMDLLRRKLVSVLPLLSGKKRSLRVLQDIENDVSRYLVTVTAINACLGLLVGGAMAAVGLGNGIVWGAAAALLNFIPYAGATVGIGLVAATALAAFDSPTAALTPPLIYFGLQVLEGGFITPMILGRRLSLSPIAILTVLSLATWMWGIVGTIIGVPLLVAFKVFCDQFPNLAGVGVFLSGEADVTDEGEDNEHSAPSSQLVRNESPAGGVQGVKWGDARPASSHPEYNAKESVMVSAANDIGTLEDLFIHTLQDIYYAENKIVKSLPKMIKKSHDARLKKGLEDHLEETREHVTRLEQVFEQVGVKPKAIDCPAIDGILEEADEVTGETAGKVLDAAIIAAAQAVEHYEMTRYGTLIAWAKQLGHDDSASLLAETLAEEKAADEKLTSVAESSVNKAAA